MGGETWKFLVEKSSFNDR